MNHQATVLKQLPKFIANRISDISSNGNIFIESIPIHQEALKKVDCQKFLIPSE